MKRLKLLDSKKHQKQEFHRQVKDKSNRKLPAQHQEDRSVWFGLGMLGLVGWSIAIPTLAGVLIGIWMDQTFPSRCSWTLTLLFLGIVFGCLNAWHWVQQESRED